MLFPPFVFFSALLFFGCRIRRASNWRSTRRACCVLNMAISFLFLYERVGNLFATINRRDDDKERSAGDNEAEFAVADVTFVIYGKVRLVYGSEVAMNEPVIASLTSSSTRFIS